MPISVRERSSGPTWPAVQSCFDRASGISSGAMATHYFPTDKVHFTWDTGNEPVLTVADGDTVVFETRDVSDNQIGPDSDVSVIAGLDWDRVYPLAGPVYVEGAEPGDTLASRSSTSTPRAGAGRRSCPGLGLLADDFTEPYLRIFDCSRATTHFREDIGIPLAPFMGTMGVCPGGRERAAGDAARARSAATWTRASSCAGTTLYLPVTAGRAVQHRRRPRLPGRRRDLRDRARGADVRDDALRVEKRSIPTPQYRTAPGPLTRPSTTARSSPPPASAAISSRPPRTRRGR